MKRKTIAIIMAAACAAFVMFGMVGCGSSATVYESGDYVADKDVEPGEYKILCDGEGGWGYYAIYSDGEKSDLLSNGNISTCAYATLDKGMMIELDDCSMVPIDEASKNTNFEGDGKYKVGFDLDPGEYKVVSGGDTGGYWAVLNAAQPNDELLGNNLFEKCSYVTVEDGQYLEISRASVVPVAKADAFDLIGGGTYKVGLDVAPGTVKMKVAKGEDYAYYEVLESSKPHADIVKNDFFSGSTSVELKKGQYLSFHSAEIISVPGNKEYKAKSSKNDTSGKVTPSFKKVLDEYESFVNEYVDFMKKYKESSNQASMVNDFTKYMEQYQDLLDELDSIDQNSLTMADASYFKEVYERCAKKMAEVM